MQTHLLAGAYFTFACWLCAAAILSLAVHVSGRRNADYLLFALLAVVLGVHSVGTGVACLNGDGVSVARWATGATVAQAASVIAAGLHLHFAIRFAAIPRQLTLSVIVYAVAGALEYLVLRGEWLDLSKATTIAIDTMGLHVSQTVAPLDPFAFAFLVGAPLAHFGACVLFGKAYLSGRRDGLGLFIGAGVLGLTASNDALVTLGALRGLSLLPIGFTVFTTTLAVAFVQRYADTRLELRRHSRELAERSNKLRKSRRLLREMRSELGRKEQLAAIGEMAAVIAHEVRNPLAVISNAVASLRREGLSRHDHDVLLSILDEEAVRLNRLVSDLLSYARPINLQRQRVVLHDMSQRATIVSTHSDAKVIYDESSVRGQIWGDANLLRQVFDNLVENAIQATGGSGTVTISVKPHARDGVDGFAVMVCDDGEGMDTQVRSRAKDPFFTTRPSGTGLGLAIVSRIVEAHGGDVSFESRAGEGTTVSVFLPIGTESAPPPDPRRVMDTDPPLSRSGETLGLDKAADV